MRNKQSQAPVKYRIRWTPSIIVLLIVLCVCAFLSIYPFFLMFSGAFKTTQEIAVNASGFPRNPTLNNFPRLWNYNSGTITRTFFNSVFVSTVYTVIALILASLAAFAFAKFTFKGKNLLFTFLLATMMVPMEVNMTPLFIMFSKIHWLNSYQVQILPGIANVMSMYMLKQYIEGLPDSVLESSMIDGAKSFTTYRQIVMPMVAPALATLTIINFLGKWNDYLMPRTMITKYEYMPIMVILPTLNDTGGVFAISWELIMAGCTIVTVPLLIVYLIFQDKFMASVIMGAVKE